TLTGNATLTSNNNGAISFAKTLNGNFALAINTGGNTTFTGAVGGTTALASLTTDTNGITAINGGLVRTSRAQAYNDAVTLGANTPLDSTNSNANTGGNVTLAAGVTGNSHSLSITAGTTGAVLLGPTTATPTALFTGLTDVTVVGASVTLNAKLT